VERRFVIQYMKDDGSWHDYVPRPILERDQSYEEVVRMAKDLKPELKQWRVLTYTLTATLNLG